MKVSLFLYKVLTEYMRWLPSKLYLRIMYRLVLGRWPKLDNPVFFTEKLQWLKLNYYNPIIPKWVSKDSAKVLASELIGESHIVRTLGVWDDFDSIDFSTFPDKFVLKRTNGGGGTGVYICRGRSGFSLDEARSSLLTTGPGAWEYFKEWPYRNLPPKIMAEEYLEDESGGLRDYKFYCFDGEPRYMLIASDRFSAHNFTYYDMQFNRLPIVCRVGNPSAEPFEKPSRYDEMIEMSRKLSSGFPHVRVDLYLCNDNVYFGELTFFDASGFDDMSSDEWNLKFGALLNLPVK